MGTNELEAIHELLKANGWRALGDGKFVRGNCSIMFIGQRAFFADGDPPSASDDTAASVAGTFSLADSVDWIRKKSV